MVNDHSICCSVCLEPFNCKSVLKSRALLHCCNHLVCVGCSKLILRKTDFYGTSLTNPPVTVNNPNYPYYSNEPKITLKFPLCPVCRSPFHKYDCLNSTKTQVSESWILSGYITSTANTVHKHQQVIKNHKSLGYQTGGLETSTGSSNCQTAAQTMLASIKSRIANTKHLSGNFDWVKNLNDLVEAFSFLSPYFACYMVQDKCALLKEIHFTPIEEEEKQKNSAAGKQKTILQELAMKKEREKFEQEHEAARHSTASSSKSAKKSTTKTAAAGKKGKK